MAAITRCDQCGDVSNSDPNLTCGRVDSEGQAPCAGTYRAVRTWTYSQINRGGADVTNNLTFTGTDAEWAEHLAEKVHEGAEVHNAYTRVI
jgi:hypothetical protein